MRQGILPIVMLGFLFPCLAVAGNEMVVSAGNRAPIPVYSTNAISSAVIANLNNGDTVEAIETKFGWTKVRLSDSGSIGYVDQWELSAKPSLPQANTPPVSLGISPFNEPARAGAPKNQPQAPPQLAPTPTPQGLTYKNIDEFIAAIKALGEQAVPPVEKGELFYPEGSEYAREHPNLARIANALSNAAARISPTGPLGLQRAELQAERLAAQQLPGEQLKAGIDIMNAFGNFTLQHAADEIARQQLEISRQNAEIQRLQAERPYIVPSTGSPLQTSGGISPTSEASLLPTSERVQEQSAAILIKSTPEGAEITIDGKFVGSTPSTVRLAPGDHEIVVKKVGSNSARMIPGGEVSIPAYRTWQRTLTLSPGSTITIDATLERIQ